VTRLLGDLEQIKTALAATEARVEAADDRAAHNEAARQRATDQASRAEKALAKTQIELATARAAADAATLRADGLAQRLAAAEAALDRERQRHDTRFAQLQEQLAQLLAQNRPARRAPTATRAKKKRVDTPTPAG
jgi:chromosome segregation ATPase